MTSDTGFAPNPFWGYCTIAHCTPNHSTKLSSGDWIMGISGSEHIKGRGKLIYIMKITEEKICLDDYFNDSRFQKKKPNMNGIWQERCGNNIYYLSSGKWHKIPSLYHTSPEDIRKDTKKPAFTYVYVSDRFWYFGENVQEIPNEFNELIKVGSNCKNNEFNSRLANKFINRIKKKYDCGVLGFPIDREKSFSCGKQVPSGKGCGIAKKISKGCAGKSLA